MTAGCPEPVPEEKPRYLIRRLLLVMPRQARGLSFGYLSCQQPLSCLYQGLLQLGFPQYSDKLGEPPSISRAKAIKGKHQHPNDLVYGAK